MKVIWLTLVMMVVEIIAGWIYGSMALLADGWHMGTHFFALGITAFAYYCARKHAGNPDYSFGTGKVDVRGGFTSSIVLALVALLMVVESLQRLFVPESIRFHAGCDGGHHHHHEHNLKAAYLRVLSDALTSVLAIVTHCPKPPGHYKALLKDLQGLHHVTVEVHLSEGAPCAESSG